MEINEFWEIKKNQYINFNWHIRLSWLDLTSVNGKELIVDYLKLWDIIIQIKIVRMRL